MLNRQRRILSPTCIVFVCIQHKLLCIITDAVLARQTIRDLKPQAVYFSVHYRANIKKNTMPPLTNRPSAMLRTCPCHRTPILSMARAGAQRRTKADIVDRHSGAIDETSRFETPFRGKDEMPTTKVPNFGKYMSKRSETSNKTFQYFMVGGMGLLAAASAKATVQGEFGGCGWIFPNIMQRTLYWEVYILKWPMTLPRLSCQYVRLSRCACPSQGRDRPCRHTFG